MSFSFFLWANSLLRLSLHTFPPGLARVGDSLLVDDRRVPEREREKNSTDLSRGYHAAIIDVNTAACCCYGAREEVVEQFTN
jgi:hypothetical protein